MFFVPNMREAVGSLRDGKPAIKSVINKDKFQDDSVLINSILDPIQKVKGQKQKPSVERILCVVRQLHDIDKNCLKKKAIGVCYNKRIHNKGITRG
jgi:hypothetical protein